MAKKSAPAAVETEVHYFGSSAFDWCVAASRSEVVDTLARMAGADVIKRNVNSPNRGFYVWTCRVDLPQKTTYTIHHYMPHKLTRAGEVLGADVPISGVRAFRIIDAKGKVSLDTNEAGEY